MSENPRDVLESAEPGVPDSDPESLAEAYPMDLQEVSQEDLRKKAEAIVDVLDQIDDVDDVVIEAMRIKSERADEKENTIAALFEGLSPKKKKAVLSSYHIARQSNVSKGHPLWIEWDKVPAHVHVHWISPRVVEGLGMRGYRRVKRSKLTESWVPNARQIGSSPFIRHANCVLGMKEKRAWLEDQVRDFQKVNVSPEEMEGTSGFRAAHKQLGITREEAARLDRTLPGIIATSGPSPEGLDLIDADQVPEIEAVTPGEKPGVDEVPGRTATRGRRR